MKKKLAKLLVSALLLSALLAAPAARAAGDRTMRIGLCYGDDTRAACRLRNVEGGGYRMGYYNDELEFVSLAWTGETAIDVLITQNLYLDSGGSFTYASDDNKGAVGCYHVHLPQAYDSYSAASAAAQSVEDGFVAWIEGTYYVRAGSYTKKSAAEDAAAAIGVQGACLGETSGFGYCAVAAGTTRILFQFDANSAGETAAFGVQPGRPEDNPVTSFGDYQYRGGFRFERISGGESTVVNIVDMESYVKGIIPYEMSASWPVEALKAQAVCARTYSSGSARHSSYHFDLCTTTHCQVYRGTGGSSANSDQAVEATAGQLALYDGKRIDAVYYSSNGGASEDAKNVWGNDFGYLKGKADPYEADIADIAGKYRWSVSYTSSSLKERLNGKGYQCTDIVRFSTKQSAVGNTIEITLQDSAGKSWTFSRAKVREVLGVNSIRFTVVTSNGRQIDTYAIAGRDGEAEGLDGLYAVGGDGSVAPLSGESYLVTADGVKPLSPTGNTTVPDGEQTFTLNGTGWGHNVGLSQWGAYAMANRGYTYDQILKFYYTGITIE